jgi:exodeoxyribonuclease VII small subunit
MSKTTSEPTPAPPPTFEAGLQQLENIVKEMETGELPLERAITLFEHGMKLSEACRKKPAWKSSPDAPAKCSRSPSRPPIKNDNV